MVAGSRYECTNLLICPPETLSWNASCEHEFSEIEISPLLCLYQITIFRQTLAVINLIWAFDFVSVGSLSPDSNTHRIEPEYNDVSVLIPSR